MTILYATNFIHIHCLHKLRPQYYILFVQKIISVAKRKKIPVLNPDAQTHLFLETM